MKLKTVILLSLIFPIIKASPSLSEQPEENFKIKELELQKKNTTDSGGA